MQKSSTLWQTFYSNRWYILPQSENKKRREVLRKNQRQEPFENRFVIPQSQRNDKQS